MNDIIVDQFEVIVTNTITRRYPGFNNAKLLAEGSSHNKALHILVNCMDTILSRVLVDTMYSLNVMPKFTLNKLMVKDVQVRESDLIVKAFDGLRRVVIGEIDLPILVGTHLFTITFQVMNINLAYSCLLGRPWIHVAGYITSKA